MATPVRTEADIRIALHDLNNVLATIVMHADLLLDDVGPGGPGRDNILAVIDAVDRGSAIVAEALGRQSAAGDAP
jgi:hypothetical protein